MQELASLLQRDAVIGGMLSVKATLTSSQPGLGQGCRDAQLVGFGIGARADQRDPFESLKAARSGSDRDMMPGAMTNL